MKILIIEDESKIRDRVKQILELEGYEVIEADNGYKGIKAAKKQLPDLILCDITMPVVNGYQVLEDLQDSEDTSEIPFIFITGKSDIADLRRGMNLGADDYLPKPFSTQELLHVIKTRLSKIEKIKTKSEKTLNQIRKNLSLSIPNEILSPLNAVIGITNLLLSDYERLSDKEIKNFLKAVQISENKLYRLIENFLLYARLSVSSKEENIQNFRKNNANFSKEILEETAYSAAAVHGRKDDLIIDCEDALLEAEEKGLEKIIFEIADNAFNFSNKNSKVKITGKTEDDKYLLIFENYGKCMTPEQIKNIGGFIQFDKSFLNHKGTGLGLIISKSLIEIFGGSLEINCEDNRKTIVKIKFNIIKTEDS